MFKFMIMAVWLCNVQSLFASSNLTEDSRSVKAALAALFESSPSNDRYDQIEQNYTNLSRDTKYRNAHKVYRLLAAMTLTGNDQFLAKVDEIWASGLKKDNAILKKIGCEWGDKKANDSEKKIYESRFLLETYRHKQKPQSVTFASPKDWSAFSFNIKSNTSNVWAPHYVRILWEDNSLPSWLGFQQTYEAPKSESASAGVIKALTLKGKQQTIYGTSDIEPSELNAGFFYAQYPRLMVIGSHEAPLTSGNRESIAVKVAKDCYVVIGQPSTLDDPVLRPHYRYSKQQLEGMRGKSPETDVEIREASGKKTKKTINWNVGLKGNHLTALPDKPTSNDGSLSDLESVKNNNLGGYALTVWATHSDGTKESYYYWVPGFLEDGVVKEALNKVAIKHGTFIDFVNELQKNEDIQARVRKDLQSIVSGENFFIKGS